LKGNGYAKGFVAVNAKATNDYRVKASLAYCANVFIHPVVYRYFGENGIEADQDLFALSEMVQWVWRSRIRDEQPITIYIPSERMRTLFLEWLHAVSITALKQSIAA